MIIGIVIGVVVLFLLILAGISVRIVREYQRIVLFRLGRALGTRGPGLIFINPVTDRTSWVDLHEQYLEIPHQTAITKSNASISIDFIIFYKVVDPSMSVSASATLRGPRRTSRRPRFAVWSGTCHSTTCYPSVRT